MQIFNLKNSYELFFMTLFLQIGAYYFSKWL